nr:B-cell receptor CD22 isoform X1 [Nothobranchius furzeri]
MIHKCVFKLHTGSDCRLVMSLILVTSTLFLRFLFVSGSPHCAANEAKLFITTSKTLKATSGSCLIIPCHFKGEEGVHLSGITFGVWIKDNPKFTDYPENVVFNSSGSVRDYPMEMTGNLSQNNCTTMFFNLTKDHSKDIFFRVENATFKATACSNPVKIKVKDSPWRPRITTSGGLEELKEKESVSITCSAPTPCPLSPPELTWNLQPDSGRQTQKNPDETSTTKIQENVTLSDTHDGYNITCSVSYPVDGGKRLKTTETVTLHVSYAPKDTSASISPSGLVSAGSWVTLSCSSLAKPPVSSFSWFRISSEGPVQVSEEQLYSFDVSEGGEFYCVAANVLGNQTSSRIKLRVGGHFSSSGAFVGGIVGIILFICAVIVFR